MPLTQLGEPDLLHNMGKSILASVAAALRCNGIDVPSRSYVGFDRPPQDCCPELVAWIGNVRPWDGGFPDTRTAGNLFYSGANGWSFDITLRIGRCYVDYSDTGPLDPETLEDWSKQLYRDATAMYFGWAFQWRAGNVTELGRCDLMTLGPLSQYNEGGCAGHEFTITVGVL